MGFKYNRFIPDDDVPSKKVGEYHFFSIRFFVFIDWQCTESGK